MKSSILKFIGMITVMGVLAWGCDNVTDSEIDREKSSGLETTTMGLQLTPFAIPAGADVFWYQDFSEDTDGWFDESNDWYGTVTHNSADETATMEQGIIPNTNVNTGPFSGFDGFRDEWPGDYFAEIDVYLDPSLAEGAFDYSVASSNSDGDHRRDFIFHVESYGANDLRVGATNNSRWSAFPESPTQGNLSESNQIQTAGWYTFQHRFFNDNGILAVEMNIFNSNQDLIFSTIRSNNSDTIGEQGEVGGNRYSWFTFISYENGIEVDNHALYQVLDEPTSIDHCKNGSFEAFGFRNQGQCIRYVNAGQDSR